MRVRHLSAGLLLTLAACNTHLENQGSNLPDGGTCPAPSPAPVGSATLQGPRQFSVQTAYESVQALVPNAPDAGVGSRPWLTVALYDAAVACGPQLSSDGGAVDAGQAEWSELVYLVLSSPSGSVGAGDYLVGGPQDGGVASGLLLVREADGGSQTIGSASGSVHLSSVAACSLSGTFDLALGLADGGTDSSLSGTFAPVYCGY